MWLNDPVTAEVIFRRTMDVCLPLMRSVEGDHRLLREMRDMIYELTLAMERISKDRGSPADVELVSKSLHIFKERWTGWEWWYVLYVTRDIWLPALRDADLHGIPFVVLHELLYMDGFPAWLKHWNTLHMF